MRGKLRIAALIVAGLLILAGGSLYWAYRASRHVPEFYTQALALDSETQEEARQQFESGVTMLYSDAQKEGTWYAVFTAKQINAWLAVDLRKKHGELIPGTVQDPRVAIRPEMITLAVRYEKDSVKTIFSFDVDVYLAEANVIAFRLHKARAGALPVPMKTVLEHVTKTAKRLEVPLRWEQKDGDPVALLTIIPERDDDDRYLVLDDIELHDGELYLSGRTVGADHRDAPNSRITSKTGIVIGLLQSAIRQ